MSVLNNIFNVAKEVTTAAGKKTDSYVQISKLKLSCVQINNEIKAKYEVLGNRVYDMMKAGEENEAEVLEMVTDIDNSFKKLTEATVKIEELRNNIVCATCGAPNKPDSLFCNKCGAKLVMPEKAPAEAADEEEALSDIDEDVKPDAIIDPEDDNDETL